MLSFSIVLFRSFETLDAFGPAEIIGKMQKSYKLGFYSQSGGLVRSSQQVEVNTLPLSDIRPGGIVLIPGGMGTRNLVHDESFITDLARVAQGADYVLTVCTGSALLARTGLLDGRRATSNKMAFDWAREQSSAVEWVHKARWVADGTFYSSSGVSAGMDMILGFIRDLHGEEIARSIATQIEYIWNEDADNDPFAV